MAKDHQTETKIFRSELATAMLARQQNWSYASHSQFVILNSVGKFNNLLFPKYNKLQGCLCFLFIPEFILFFFFFTTRCAENVYVLDIHPKQPTITFKDCFKM